MRLTRPTRKNLITGRNIEPHFQELASWARLAFAPMGTVCSPSTFCLYPTIAAARGFWALDKTNSLFSAAEDEVAQWQMDL